MDDVPLRPAAAAAMPVHAEARLRHIDALRALAALLVVWLHVSETYVGLAPGGALPGRGLFELARGIDVGRIGVVVFFLISGYVIPSSIRPQSAAPIGTFLIRRVMRIYPAYWLSIPFAAFACHWLWGQSFGVRDFLLNLTLLQDVFGAPGAEGLYWTLLVELVFYALCVGLLLSHSLARPARLAVLAGTLALYASTGMLLHWLDVTGDALPLQWLCLNLSVMLCGTLYRSFVDGHAGGALARHGTRALFAFYLVVFPACTAAAIGWHRNAAVPYALGVLLFLAGCGPMRIASRVTDWLGRISYSIYLFHPIVFYPILWWLLRQPAGSAWRSQHLGIYLAIVVVLTLALANLVYRVVEAPGIRLGRTFAARWSARKPAHFDPLPALARATD